MNLSEHYFRLKMFSMFLYSLYRKLARLEMENKKDGIEYTNTLILINKIKKEENLYYDKLSKLSNEKSILSFSVYAQKDVFGEIKSDKSLYSPETLISSKISKNQIIAMRISSKIMDIFRHKYHSSDNAILNVYDTYTPIRDKYFLDILSDQIDDDDYSDCKKMLINTKYDYAFVFDKDILELKEYDESLEDNENISLYVGLGTILEYKDKFISSNNEILLNPKNRRRLIMDVNFVRANALCVPIEYLEALKLMISNSDEELTEGKKFFLNLLDITIEDKDNFEEEDIPYKRKF